MYLYLKMYFLLFHCSVLTLLLGSIYFSTHKWSTASLALTIIILFESTFLDTQGRHTDIHIHISC